MAITVQQNHNYQYQDVKVLYVEDEVFSREKLLRIINRRFSDVHVAIDGEEGFQLYQQHLPDLIIVDIKVMSGLDMIKNIRKHNEKVQIIVTTAHDDNDVFIQCIEHTVNHFILKPIDLDRFLLAIQKSVQQIQQEKGLLKQNQLTKALIDTQDHLLFIEDHGHIVEFNQAFATFTGIEKTKGLHKSNLVAALFVEDSNYFYPKNKGKWIEEIIQTEKKYAKVMWKGQKDKQGIYLMKGSQIPGKKQILFVCTEISLLEEEYKKNEILSMMDPLTHSLNRKKFEELLASEISRSERYNHPFSIILMDIDYFNNVNDYSGHKKGDEVLVTISTIVQQRIRESDVLARWGGDAFILLTPETNSPGAMALAESIRALINTFVFPKIGSVTCSFGVAEFSAGKSKIELISEVEQALSKSKIKGRNCVTFFNSSIGE
ncbi:GGDEF domain-containing response regulator [Neobacillus niacini]|uniref:GGDEF domain-containing response regulator n=1 Tax=Neobacillus niacini TaxID=86668 RepID=UPI00300014F4